jgi:hypothetical protein
MGFGFPPALVLNNHAMVYDEAKGHLALLDQKLAIRAKKKLPFWPIEGAASSNGRTFAVADDSTLALGKVTAAGKITIVDTVDYSSHLRTARRSLEVQTAKTRYDPKRMHGTPAVGFAAGRSSPPWAAKAGKEFIIELVVRSSSGAGQGVSVTLSGEALKHANFKSAAIRKTRVPLVTNDDGSSCSVEFAEVKLEEGLVYPLDPAPKNEQQKLIARRMLDSTHFTIRLHGKAKAQSSDLLAVSIAALNSASPPLKWMRPFTIKA